MRKILHYFGKHKIITGLVLLAIGGGYYYFSANSSSSTITSYVLGNVSKGDIVVSVTGTGSVTSASQIDLKPKSTTNIDSIMVKVQDPVKAGQTIMQLDTKDLKTQLTSAQSSLQVANANLKLKLDGPTKENIAISQNSIDSAKLNYNNSVNNLASAKSTAGQNLAKAQTAVDNAQRQYNDALNSQNISGDSSANDLTTAYNNAKNSISSALITDRSALTAVDNILNINNTAVKNLYGAKNSQSLSAAQTSFDQAKSDLANLETSFSQVSATWSQSGTDNLLQTAQISLQSMKTLEHNMYTLLANTITSVDLSQATLDGYKQTMSSQESSMVSGISSLQSSIQAITNARLGNSSSGISSSASIANAKSSLVTAQSNLVQAGLDNKKSIDAAQSDIAQKKISQQNAQAQYNLLIAKPQSADLASSYAQITQADASYQTAIQNLKDATIVSPIDGVIASLPISAGYEVSPSTIVATVITKQQLASVSLNEVDVAKIKVGQKATLTFNAVDGLSISGAVASVDTIGVITQNVVNYGVKIALDTSDPRIKPEMSVSAIIVTDQKFNVLTVPSAAIKTDNNGSYVEVLTNPISTTPGQATTTSSTYTSVTGTEKKYIQTGLADDTNTEVTQGLAENDPIVTQTIAGSTAAKTTTSGGSSGLNLLGGGGNRGGGSFRPGG